MSVDVDHGLSEPRVTFRGPLGGQAVVVNGWQVPLVEAHANHDDRVLLVIDGRLGAEFSVEEAERVIPFIADAIAVALGYARHPRDGEESPPPMLPVVRPRRLTALVGASTENAATP